MRLSLDTLKEAEKDIQKLRNPSYGGYNLCYGDGYFADHLIRKWGMSINELDKRCHELRDSLKGTNGEGI